MKFILCLVVVNSLFLSSSFADVSCADYDHCMQSGYSSVAKDDIKSASIYFREALKLSAQDCAQGTLTKIECSENMETASKQLNLIKNLSEAQDDHSQGGHDNYQQNAEDLRDVFSLVNTEINAGDYASAMRYLQDAKAKSDHACRTDSSSYDCQSRTFIQQQIIELENNSWYQSQLQFKNIHEKCDEFISRLLHPGVCGTLR